LAEQLDFGHPLVRRLGGAWVGRQNCLWISWGVKYLRGGGDADPSAEARRSKYLGADLEMFAEDVRSGKPDILLVESKELADWARAQPALSGLFDAYVQAESAGDIAGIFAPCLPRVSRERVLHVPRRGKYLYHCERGTGCLRRAPKRRPMLGHDDRALSQCGIHPSFCRARMYCAFRRIGAF
jgi:hypothetical protein